MLYCENSFFLHVLHVFWLHPDECLLRRAAFKFKLPRLSWISRWLLHHSLKHLLERKKVFWTLTVATQTSHPFFKKKVFSSNERKKNFMYFLFYVWATLLFRLVCISSTYTQSTTYITSFSYHLKQNKTGKMRLSAKKPKQTVTINKIQNNIPVSAKPSNSLKTKFYTT